MKNKRGQTLGIAIMVAIMILIVGLMCINFLKDEVSRARNSENLDCADNTISDGNKLTCLVVDTVIPYYIVLIFAVVGGLITARLTL